MQQPRAHLHLVTNDHQEHGPGLLRRLVNWLTMAKARLHLDSGYISWSD